MYRSSSLRSILSTGYIKVRTCVKYVPKQSIAQRFEHVCKCKRMSSSPPHPTHPTLSHVMCARVTLRGKNDAKLCLCVLVTPVCVRGWLWKMAVCARDSSLCARVTLGGKNDAKLCLCVLVTPECVRGWPPDRCKEKELWTKSLFWISMLSKSRLIANHTIKSINPESQADH